MYKGQCCVICRDPLDDKRTSSAKYCGKKCKHKAQAVRRRNDRLQQKLDIDRIIKSHELWFSVFQQELRNAAPPEAGGYQLGLWTGQETYWFPSMRKGQKNRNTLHGRRTRHACFSLFPFEPPAVPIVAWYRVRYVQAVPPYPPLSSGLLAWRKKVPYAVPCGPLPFNLRAVSRDQR